jgi:hypothetical protein
MDYTKHYNSLINKAKNRIKEDGVYYEKHHIILRAEGGTDSQENIVDLTAREHFLAHWLLSREDTSSYARAEAFRMMCDVDPSFESKRYVPSSRIVAEAREISAKLKSKLYKSKCWVKKGKEQKFIFKEEIDGYIELGWEKGRHYRPSEETKEKIRQSRAREGTRGEEFKAKMSAIVKSRYRTNPEQWKKSKSTKEKISLKSSEKWKSEEFRKKFRETRNGRKVKCPHCGKEGNYGIMQRWHFNSCKNKK